MQKKYSAGLYTGTRLATQTFFDFLTAFVQYMRFFSEFL